MKEKVPTRKNNLKLQILVALSLLTVVNTCAPQKNYNGCCFDNCPPTFFANWQHPYQCNACNHPCENCIGPWNGDCWSCRPGFIQFSLACCLPNQYSIYPNCLNCHHICSACTGPNNTDCVACHPGTYLDGLACVACHAQCSECTGPTASECSVCRYGFYLDGTSCNQCDPACIACTAGGTNSCTRCASPNYLDGTTCAPTCPAPKSQ